MLDSFIARQANAVRKDPGPIPKVPKVKHSPNKHVATALRGLVRARLGGVLYLSLFS